MCHLEWKYDKESFKKVDYVLGELRAINNVGM